MAKDSNNNDEKYTSIRVYGDTKNKLEEFYVETTWIKVKSFDDKINFLLWFYWSHINNNSKD